MQSLGVILLILAYFSLCLTSLVMHFLIEKGASIFLAFGFQNICIIFFLLMRALIFKKPIGVPKKPKMVFLRAFTGLVYSICYFSALHYASFAEVGVLTNSFPIFVVLIAWICLGERVGPTQWIALFAGMLGVWFILIPGVDDLWNVGMVFATIASLFWAISLIVMQKVTDFEDVYVYLLYFFMFTFFMLLPFMIYYFEMPSYEDIFFYICAALISLLAQGLMFHAYRLCSAAELAPYNYSFALFHFLLAKGLFSFIPTNYFYVGATLIFFGGIINLVSFEKKLSVKKKSSLDAKGNDSHLID